MAYHARSGDIITLGEPNDHQAMTLSVPLDSYTGELDPIGLYKAQSAVRTVVDFLAWTLGSIPLHQYTVDEKGGRSRVRAGAIANALRRPSAARGAFRLRQALYTDLFLHDRWVVYPAWQDDGTLHFYRIPAAVTRIIVDKFGEPQGVRVGFPSDGSRYHDIPATDVIFDVGYTVTVGGSTTTGYSTLFTLRDLAEELREAGRFRRMMWKNGAQVPVVIERPAGPNGSNWSDAARRRFERSFARYRAGGGREGHVPILEDGMKLTKVDAYSPSETQYVEVRKLALAEAASAFRVPPELVGAREGTHSNIDAYREQLYQDVLGPYVMAFEQAWDIGLADLIGESDYIEANVDAKLRGSFEQQAKTSQALVGAPVMTRNEQRQRLNLPGLPGGDELVTPLNVLVGGLASPLDTGPKTIGPPHTKSARPTDLAPLATEASALETALEKFWKGQATRLETALETEAKKALPPITELLDWETETKQLAAILHAHGIRVAEAGAWEVLETWDPDTDEYDTTSVEAWIGKASQTHAENWHDGLTKRLTTLLTSGDWENNLGEIATWALAAVFAATIAKEFGSFGGHDAARKTGLGTKTWEVTSSNPRSTHASLDGVTVAIDDIFDNGARYPGDYAAGPGETSNCSCRLTYGQGPL